MLLFLYSDVKWSACSNWSCQFWHLPWSCIWLWLHESVKASAPAYSRSKFSNKIWKKKIAHLHVVSCSFVKGGLNIWFCRLDVNRWTLSFCCCSLSCTWGDIKPSVVRAHLQLNMRDVEGISRASFVPLSRGQIKQCSAFRRGEDAQHVSNMFIASHAPQACISTNKLCCPEGNSFWIKL